MVEYKCLRCGYTTTHKGSLVNHLNRKNICRPLLEDISIEDLKKLYNLKTTKNIPNDSISFQNDSISFQNHSKMVPPTIPKYSISFQNDSKIFQNIPKYSKKHQFWNHPRNQI